MKKVKESSESFSGLFLLLLIIGLSLCAFVPIFITLHENKYINDVQENYNITEDITMIEILNVEHWRGGSSYTIRDNYDDSIYTLNGTVFNSAVGLFNGISKGDLLEMDCRHYYNKDTGKEDKRQYKLQQDNWPEVKFIGSELGGIDDTK